MCLYIPWHPVVKLSLGYTGSPAPRHCVCVHTMAPCGGAFLRLHRFSSPQTLCMCTYRGALWWSFPQVTQVLQPPDIVYVYIPWHPVVELSSGYTGSPAVVYVYILWCPVVELSSGYTGSPAPRHCVCVHTVVPRGGAFPKLHRFSSPQPLCMCTYRGAPWWNFPQVTQVLQPLCMCTYRGAPWWSFP